MATALGIVAFLSPVTVVVLLALFAAVVYFTRYVSLGSLCAAVGLPVMMAVLEGPRSYLNLSLLIAFVVFFTHRENIHRLWRGRSPDSSSPARPEAKRPDPGVVGLDRLVVPHPLHGDPFSAPASSSISRANVWSALTAGVSHDHEEPREGGGDLGVGLQRLQAVDGHGPSFCPRNSTRCPGNRQILPPSET